MCTKEKNIVRHHIPTLGEVFSMIEKGELSLESDEVLSYFFCKDDIVPCTGTFNQLISLYQNENQLHF